MSDQDDDPNRRFALWLVFGVVAAVVIGVVSYGVMRGRGAPPVDRVEVVDSVPAGPANVVLYFDLARAELPDGSALLVAQVRDGALAAPQAEVLVSGYHDASGDPARNAELAKQRALAVRAALLAAGLPPRRVLLVKPIVTTGDGSDREARRVEVRLLDLR